MTRICRLLATILAFTFLTPAFAAQFIVELKQGASISDVVARYNLVLVRSLSEEGQTVYLVSAPDPVSATLLMQLRNDAAVRELEYDAEVRSDEIPSTPAPIANVAALVSAIQDRTPVSYYGSTVRSAYAQQPAASLINLPGALARVSNAAGPIVAVIDTGVDPNHPALKNALVPGYDFTRNLPGSASELTDLTQSTVAILDQSTVAILDSKHFPVVLNQSTVAILDQSTVAILDTTQLPVLFGHGTMTAGLIHLVAPTARIMPLKAFRADGSADLADIVRAIYYAVDNHAKVINMSFSSPIQSPAITAALKYALSHNVLCVASGGNNGRKVVVYPAGDQGVIGVGSTTAQDRRSAFSNYDVWSVRTAAPGEALITTFPGNNYAGVWGTSFSTALTSGAVALFTLRSPQLRSNDASDALDHGHKLQVDGLGDARLDVLASLMYVH